MISPTSFLRSIFLSSNRINHFLKATRNMSKWSSPQEIRIPIAYGYLAAQVWGKENHEPVLALHGWQTDSGTFDKLIPLLNQDLHIVAVDSPGHGLSSHKPAGAPYHFIESLVEVERVVNYLKWDAFSIIGHSLGATTAVMYSSLFPEKVKNLVLIDILKPISYDQAELCKSTRYAVETLISLEKKYLNEAPVYSPEEAKKRLIAGLFNQITPESADILLKRGSRPSKCGKGVGFSRDLRLQKIISLQKFSHDDIRTYIQNVKCNVLMFLTEETPEPFKPHASELVEEFLNLYKKNCKSFQCMEVKGTHFAHLNNPERIAPHIDSFFEEKCKR